MLRPVVTLCLIGLVAALTLAGVHLATRDRIALAEQRRALEMLHQVLPPDDYDNELVRDRFSAWIAGLQTPSTIYRARLGDEPVALLADVTTATGYSGPIRLIVGIEPDGEVIAVRVVSHRETPGLGDRIERRRTDWIDQFAGRNLGDPPAPAWKPDRRSGQFDTLTSATITSAAVVEAIRRVLEWRAANAERIFEIPAEMQ